MIEKDKLSVDELLEIMPGPDFPLGGVVLNIKDVRVAYENGKSNVSLKIQGDYEIDGQKIIFTTIPYRTYRNKIKEQIEKNIDTFAEVLDDYDDDSSVGENRLVFHVKSGVSPTVALKELFLLTDLQTTLSYNMNYIVNGTPKLCSMIDLLRSYVNHQESILIKATEFDKVKAETRAHILRGLIAAVDAIDEVIARIKAAKDRAAARESLKEYLTIDDIQANAILDMKLGKLTKIDKEELVNELKEKEEFIIYCNNILNNKDSRNTKLVEIITKLRDTYGDNRRTKLLNVELPKKEKIKEAIPDDSCTVIVNYKGMIRRTAKKPVLTNDIVFHQETQLNKELIIFTSLGKVYKLPIHTIPDTSLGAPIVSLIELSKDEVPLNFTIYNEEIANKFIFFATKKGIVKKVSVKEYDAIKRSGTIGISLKEDDIVVNIHQISENNEAIYLCTKNGMVIHFNTTNMPISSRTAQGVKGIKLADDDCVIATFPHNATWLAVVHKNGTGKRIALTDFPEQNRGGKGLSASKEEIVGYTLVSDGNKLILNNSITVPIDKLPIVGRTAIGNTITKGIEIVTCRRI